MHIYLTDYLLLQSFFLFQTISKLIVTVTVISIIIATIIVLVVIIVFPIIKIIVAMFITVSISPFTFSLFVLTFSFLFS